MAPHLHGGIGRGVRARRQARTDEGRPIPVLSRQVLPLGAVVAGGLQRTGEGAPGAGGWRSARRKFRDVAGWGGAALLGRRRFRRRVSTAVYQRFGPPGGLREAAGRLA